MIRGSRTQLMWSTLVIVLTCVAVTRGQPAPATSAAGADCTGGDVVEVLFRQPALESDEVSRRIIGDVQPAGETFLIRVANMGPDVVAEPILWDVGRFTGFRPSEGDLLAGYQRGSQPAQQGTAVQLRGTEIGIWIDSDHPRPERGSLLPVCPAYWWWDVESAPRPFRAAGSQLAFAFDLRVPTAQRDGEAEVYICAYFLLRDRRSGRQFWLGATLFDPRGEDHFPDTVHRDNWEAGTGLPILFTALNARSRWLCPGPDSAHFTAAPFIGYRPFELRVSASQLRYVIQAIKDRWPDHAGMSDDPSDYQLVHWNVNPEVYAPAGSRGRLGLSLRAIRVLLIVPDGGCQPATEASVR